MIVLRNEIRRFSIADSRERMKGGGGNGVVEVGSKVDRRFKIGIRAEKRPEALDAIMSEFSGLT